MAVTIYIMVIGMSSIRGGNNTTGKVTTTRLLRSEVEESLFTLFTSLA